VIKDLFEGTSEGNPNIWSEVLTNWKGTNWFCKELQLVNEPTPSSLNKLTSNSGIALMKYLTW